MAPVDVYFMFNSAVPAEAYDTDAPTYDFSIEDVPEGLIHDDWDAYPPKSYAALWYRHFLPHEGFVPEEGDDARAQLTWKGRFKDVIKNRGVEVYNYYSAGSGSESGDEVLELSPSTPRPITGMLDSLGRYAWHKQEAYKGRVAKTSWAGALRKTVRADFQSPKMSLLFPMRRCAPIHSFFIIPRKF